MGGAVISPGFGFDLGLLSADRWGQIFPKWPPLEEHMPVSTPETFASSVLPSSDPQSLPVFPGDPPRTAVGPAPDSHGVSTLSGTLWI